jgi:AbrB family looped-hinge helix DNA binding protein
MPDVTISSKNQITLPVEILRRLGLKSGDKLIVQESGRHIVLFPRPESWIEAFAGSMRGVYGETIEDIDRYIEELRDSPERRAWDEEFKELYRKDQDARLIIDILWAQPKKMATKEEIYRKAAKQVRPHIPEDLCSRLDMALDRLLKHGGVRMLPDYFEDKKRRYRLFRELAGLPVDVE